MARTTFGQIIFFLDTTVRVAEGESSARSWVGEGEGQWDNTTRLDSNFPGLSIKWTVWHLETTPVYVYVMSRESMPFTCMQTYTPPVRYQ